MQQKLPVLPKYVTQYFWGDNLDELSWQNHQRYITQTLLEKGDEKAIKWLFSKTSGEKIKIMLPQLKLSKKSANFWSIYLN